MLLPHETQNGQTSPGEPHVKQGDVNKTSSPPDPVISVPASDAPSLPLPSPALASLLPESSAVAPRPLPTPSPWAEGVKQVGGLRDGLIVTGILIYGVGAAVWSYHAWRFNLGLLPVLDIQYFVAGIVPVLIVMSVFMVTYLTKSLLEMFWRLLGSAPHRLKHLARNAIMVLYGLDGAAFALLWMFGRRLNAFHILVTVMLYVSLGILMAGSPLFARILGKDTSQEFHLGRAEWPTIGIYPALIGALCLYLYAGFVYPQLNQSFGGASPRVAYLDVKMADASPENRAELFPPTVAKLKLPILRTILVDVFFFNKETLVVKPHSKWLDNRTYQLDASSFKAITWVDPATLGRGGLVRQ